MSDSRPLSRLLAPIAGVVGVVLFLVGTFLPGQPPKPDDNIEKVVTFLTDHRGALLVGTALAGIAFIALLVFLAELTVLLYRSGRDVMSWVVATVLSWIGLFVIYTGVGVPLTAVVWRGAADVDPSLVRLVVDIQNLGTFSITACVAALTMIAPSVVILRTGVLPRWLVGIAALEVLVNVVELVGVGSRTGSNAAGYAFGLGPFVWMVWVLGASFAMYQGSRTARAA